MRGKTVTRGSVLVARCPEHGLHGCRDKCFVCGGPVEQVEMTPVTEWTPLAATHLRSWPWWKRAEWKARRWASTVCFTGFLVLLLVDGSRFDQGSFYAALVMYAAETLGMRR